MFSSLTLALVSVLATHISASSLAERIPLGNGLAARTATSGGFAVRNGDCANDSTQQCLGNAGFCCPTSLQCVSDATYGDHCCPKGTSCLAAYQSSPQCADDSWSLWRIANSKSGQGFFCCLPGQIGTNTGIGICVTPNTPVVASLSASLLSSATGSVAPASSASKASSSTLASAKTTATSSASASASASTSASSSASAATTVSQSSTATSSAAQATKSSGANSNVFGAAENFIPIAILAGGFAAMI